jgi:hypothetical protein
MTARTKKVWLILALVLPAAFMVAASHLHRITWAPTLFSAFVLVPLWYFNRGMRETERVQIEAAKIIDRLLVDAIDPDVIAAAVEWLRKHASYIVPLTAQTRTLMAAKQQQLPDWDEWLRAQQDVRREHPMALNDKDTIPPPSSADLLPERIARLVHEAREAGLSDETIAAELQDAANALLEGLS